ncbi:3-hydroxybutyrate dehydrogenase [Azospirillum sp. ST 5-10]|uniref:3-hydroxybutyrate dehydrogenase n=1 Tax=unclassified Azospirillum TaxID=2630922 RepID=UPI003F4A0C31
MTPPPASSPAAARAAARAALVTGATGGIGAAIAAALAAQGRDLMLSGLGEADAVERQCAALAAAHGVRVAHHGADLRDPAAVRALVRAAEEAYGGVDVLVNNAGIQHVAALHLFPDDRWDEVLAVNLSAAFHATKAVLPEMMARRRGRIVNVASALGLVGAPHKPAYVAAKHGLVGLTRATALEVAELGITCNAVCPGLVMTPIIERQVAAQAQVTGLAADEVVKTVFLANQPTRRPVGVEEVAAAVAFLASEAAASITGTALPVDGGWTAR